jgi:hypothetical protein
MKQAIIWTLVVSAFFGVLLLAKPDKTQSENGGGGKLTAAETSYDFGAISMKAGNVKHAYIIKNTSDKPAVITKAYTSCMCTEVSVGAGGQQTGPFGMLGHGEIPDIEVELEPGEEAQVVAEFDPAAHGSAGVGDIKRSVFVQPQSGPRMELTFKATVKP